MQQRRFWSQGHLERRAGDRRTGERRTKAYDAEKGVWEYPMLEEGVLTEIRLRMQSAGAKVFRVRERIPSCPRCHAFVGQASEPGHPDLHGYFPVPALARLGRADIVTPLPWYIEVKREKGGVKRPEQVSFIADRNADGVPAFFANSWATAVECFKPVLALALSALIFLAGCADPVLRADPPVRNRPGGDTVSGTNELCEWCGKAP